MKAHRQRLQLAYLLALPALLLLPPGKMASAQQLAKDPHATMAHAMPNASFTLRTGIAQGKMVYIGRGGAIDGKVNPTLTVHENDVVQSTLINGEGAKHDLVLPDFRTSSQPVNDPGASSVLVFNAANIGTFSYFCTLSGHREAGMEGLLKVEPSAPKVATNEAVSISRAPDDLPSALVERGPTTVRYELEAIERIGRLTSGVTYDF